MIEIQCGFGVNIGPGIERCEDVLNNAQILNTRFKSQAYRAKPAVDPVVEMIAHHLCNQTICDIFFF